MLDCFLSFWLDRRTVHFVTPAGALVVFQAGVFLVGPLLDSCDAGRYSPFRHLLEGRTELRPAELLILLAEDLVGTRRTPSWTEKVGALLYAVVMQVAQLVECTKDDDHWARHTHFELRVLRGVKRLRRISVARKQALHSAVSGCTRLKRVSGLLAAQELIEANLDKSGAAEVIREKPCTGDGYVKDVMYNSWLALRRSGVVASRLSISLGGTRVSGHEVIDYACWNCDSAAACWLPPQALRPRCVRWANLCCSFRVCLWCCRLRVCWWAIVRYVI